MIVIIVLGIIMGAGFIWLAMKEIEYRKRWQL